MYKMVINCSLYTFYLLIEMLFVYVLLTFELSNFTLRTNVPGNGQIEIIGVGVHNPVLFKFTIDEDRLDSSVLLPGLARQEKALKKSVLSQVK